jgi:hypothetical protein
MAVALEVVREARKPGGSGRELTVNLLPLLADGAYLLRFAATTFRKWIAQRRNAATLRRILKKQICRRETAAFG